MDLSKLSVAPKTILCIDASTNSMAYSIFNDDKLADYGKVSFDGTTVYSKIVSAVTAVYNKIKEVSVEAVVIERAVYINSPKTMSELSMVQGAILAGAGLAGIKRFKGTNPIAWQSFIGNKVLTKDQKLAIINANPGKSKSFYKAQERKLRKDKTISFVNVNYGLSITDDDIADAIGIGHYAIHNWNKLGD